MFVNARCSKQGGHFAIAFVQRGESGWEATETLRAQAGQNSERGGMRSLAGIYLGPRYAGCPYCDNRNIFLCGTCNSVNCQASVRKNCGGALATCANCKRGIYLEGTVERLDGWSEVGEPSNR
jgi:hypothetical protein